jgi:cell wall-associated NlpC family hydrolase
MHVPAERPQEHRSLDTPRTPRAGSFQTPSSRTLHGRLAVFGAARHRSESRPPRTLLAVLLAITTVTAGALHAWLPAMPAAPRAAAWALASVGGGMAAHASPRAARDTDRVTGSLTFGAPAPSTIRVGVTTEEGVNLRRGPATTFDVIAKLPRGTTLEMLNQQQDWYRVATARGTVGWIAAAYFSLKPANQKVAAPEQREVSGMIIDDGVNLRAGPSTRHASHGKLNQETPVIVLAQQTGWYQVRSPRGTLGWVSSEFVALDRAATHLFDHAAGAGPAGNSNDAARLAERFVGAPYIWGGATPRGFDCSGLTQYVYRQLGIELPRRAMHQYSTRYGKRIIRLQDLAPGDLVFFERTTEERGITHVGIYVGNGHIVAARSERLGVRYVSVYEPFWNTRYVGAIRPYR